MVKILSKIYICASAFYLWITIAGLSRISRLFYQRGTAFVSARVNNITHIYFNVRSEGKKWNFFLEAVKKPTYFSNSIILDNNKKEKTHYSKRASPYNNPKNTYIWLWSHLPVDEVSNSKRCVCILYMFIQIFLK